MLWCRERSCLVHKVSPRNYLRDCDAMVQVRTIFQLDSDTLVRAFHEKSNKFHVRRLLKLSRLVCGSDSEDGVSISTVVGLRIIRQPRVVDRMHGTNCKR